MAEAYQRMTAATNQATVGHMLSSAEKVWPFHTAVGIVDEGCGPGPIMDLILSEYGRKIPLDCKLMCTDFSDGIVAWVERRKQEFVTEDNESAWAG